MLDAAVAASRVVHPHLVDVYDAIDEGTRAYVVREWVDGGSLREHVVEAPLDSDRATSVASAVASAIAAVHASGATHGNIHPGTVLIGSDGRVVLADARADGSCTPDKDIRAVGAILYCALTGRWPHAEAGPDTLPDALRDPTGALVEPRQIRGGLPAHLSDIATELLDPTIPLPSADVLAADLSRLSTPTEEAILAATSPLDFGSDPYPYQGAVAMSEPRQPIAKKLAIGVAGLVVLALVSVLLITQFAQKGSTGPTTPNVVATTSSSAANGQPRQIAIGASQVRSVDASASGDRSEGVAANAFDGNQNTVWKTQHYKHSPNFGNIAQKQGKGILINLESPRAISQVEIDFTTPGATVQLFTGSTDPGNNYQGDQQILNTYTRVGSPSVADGVRKVISLDRSKVQYILVWISKLPPEPEDGGYIVQISEIKVFENA